MKWLITGGAGFVGCNTAKRLIERGDQVVIFDNLSRRGASANLGWLSSSGSFQLIQADVRDYGAVEAAIRDRHDVDVLLHLAAQVAVTTSVRDPRQDFEINALGTLNVCEAIRQSGREIILLNASTNKVYGALEHEVLTEEAQRYMLRNRPDGIAETQPLDFHSPYGCSKGAADQYVRDYGRIYGLPTVCFRQSCIYGRRQFGIEDQGWVAWFLIAALTGKPITVYGDGKQVRDLLFVDDLVECYLAAVERIETTRAQIYNVGGGADNTLSLLELLALIRERYGVQVNYRFEQQRPGDQKIFVSDIGKARRELDWQPHISVLQGIDLLVTWLRQHIALFDSAT